MPRMSDILDRLRQGELQRILAFGSSNTERFAAGMHWFDCLDLAIRQSTGRRCHRCINTGISGNTTADLLARFEQDAAFYQPHAVVITIGGNDANPNRAISEATYRENLHALHQRFKAMDCAVIFQTYYAPNPHAGIDPVYLQRFYQYMQALRDVAAETGAELIDQLARWEPFRQRYAGEYIQLMRDAMHVNHHGNMVMGLEIARHFQWTLNVDDRCLWDPPRRCQAWMDQAAEAMALAQR